MEMATRSERGGDADDTAPRLAGLPEAELDAIVCALETRHRRPLRLASRRLCRAVDARLGRVAVAAAAPRPQGEGGAGAAPRGLPLSALPQLAARFPRASCVVFNARRVPRVSLPCALNDDAVQAATNEELAVDAAALAASLRALPDGAWPCVEAAEGGTARFDLPASYERTGPLRPAVLLELARLCPRLSSASGLVIAAGAAGWGAPAAAGVAAAPAGEAPPLPPSLASVTRLGLHLFSFPGDSREAGPGPATAEVLSALPGLRELRVRGWSAAAVRGALRVCGALERLAVEGDCPHSVLSHVHERAKAGEPLAALTSLELRHCFDETRPSYQSPELTGDDLAALGAACPALRDLTLDGVVLSNLDDYAEGAPPPQLRGLTRLRTGFDFLDCAPLREWAPALHTLAVRDTQDVGLWLAAAAPPPALRRLEFDATRGGRESARMVGSWMAGVSELTALTALELRFGGGALAEEPPPPAALARAPSGGSGSTLDSGVDLLGLCAVQGRGGGERSSEDSGSAAGGGDGSRGEDDGGEEAGAVLSRFCGWAGLWPPLRSLAIEVAGARLPAAELLAALRGAPLEGTLAELRLAGLVLGDEAEAARTLACAREFPALQFLDLRLRSGGDRTAEDISALRAFAAPLASARAVAGGGEERPRVTLGIPEAWMRPRGPLSWAECEGLGAAHALLSVVID
ncbi:MAG: hypothetical protein J3K34DRAFT_497423 [Monoraphidium minutum]|nr:MAG: hypothetical protein J3K34DRAFT_497423 [Monoraphidium minutum]